MSKNDGGPAFPVECSDIGDGELRGKQTSPVSGWETGMTLRDYFAGQIVSTAMANMLAHPTSRTNLQRIALAAYELSNHMIEVRKMTREEAIAVWNGPAK